ncbi:MAG: undecaprenyl/decaprenyl-phosphate alpha-N-acetylglucosaminyl 1-phosphate transferase [Planctomycetes bacterium]|nr:undecaprenyl/decaprenyl-phosphate alpha-N-acetylglucosaminyl 1-phosphate transferase [Planctomycetota bacterium]
MFFDGMIGDERPVSWVLQFWPVLAVSFACALAATALCKKIALKFGIVDKPDNLVKTHKEPVAYLGGIGILVGLTVGILAGMYIVQTMQTEDEQSAMPFKWLLGILAGAGVSCFVGVVDDIFDISPAKKMLGQVLAAVILLLAGIRPALHYFTDFVNVDMSPGVETVLGIPVVVFFVLGATNSLNLLDGLDGLCGGVTAIIALGMLILATHLGTWEYSSVGDPVRVIVCLAIVGGVFGFLPFNRHPAKIFMGDAGSVLLGFVAAALMIMFAEKVPRWWFASVVLMGFPILDTAAALVRRLINHKPLFVSDRGHSYDQMIDREIPLKKTVSICYLLSGMYAFIGLGLAISPLQTRYVAAIYILVAVVSAFVVWKKGFLKMEGLRGAVHKEE